MCSALAHMNSLPRLFIHAVSVHTKSGSLIGAVGKPLQHSCNNNNNNGIYSESALHNCPGTHYLISNACSNNYSSIIKHTMQPRVDLICPFIKLQCLVPRGPAVSTRAPTPFRSAVHLPSETCDLPPVTGVSTSSSAVCRQPQRRLSQIMLPSLVSGPSVPIYARVARQPKLSWVSAIRDNSKYVLFSTAGSRLPSGSAVFRTLSLASDRCENSSPVGHFLLSIQQRSLIRFRITEIVVIASAMLVHSPVFFQLSEPHFDVTIGGALAGKHVRLFF